MIARPAHIDVRLALHFNAPVHSLASSRATGRPQIIDRTTASRSVPPRLVVKTAQRQLVERIFARQRRLDSTTRVQNLVELMTISRETARVVSRQVPLFQPALAVPMITRRMPQPVPPQETRSVQEQAPRSVKVWSTSSDRQPNQSRVAPIPLTPSELSQLTDHVVNAIDRRFTAHRERFGRL
jgi:hypothetical protein